MSDTLAKTEAFLEERYRQLTPGQRIEMACGMWTTAVALARAGICASEPGLTEAEIRVRLVRRLHAQDAGSPAVDKCFAAIGDRASRQRSA